MVLKCKEIKDLYKSITKHHLFSTISQKTLEDAVLFFVQEKQTKWASQCFCQKCGNGIAAVRYINQLGEKSNDVLFKNLNENNWYQHLVCDGNQTLVNQMICLRNKKSIKKCFKHKKVNRRCEGNILITLIILDFIKFSPYYGFY